MPAKSTMIIQWIILSWTKILQCKQEGKSIPIYLKLLQIISDLAWSRLNRVIVEHENSFQTSGPGLLRQLLISQTSIVGVKGVHRTTSGLSSDKIAT